MVIGDSAAASLGVVAETFPEILGRGRLPRRVINAALVGMTSADAVALFDGLARDLEPGDAVVICLGHCDASGFGPLKPRFPFLAPILRRAIQPWYQSLNPWSVRSSPYEFTSRTSFVETLPCVAPDEFEANLGDLVRRARRRRLRVILLNPFGQRWFPPANHFPSALFLRVFGGAEHHPFAASGGSELPHALSEHQAGHLEAAQWLYRKIRAEGGPTARCVAWNNEAEIAFSRGDAERALGLCRRAAAEETPLALVSRFNKALALRKLGFADAAERTAAAVLDDDRGSYRISSAHREAARRVADACAGPDLSYLDLAELLEPDDVMDYCHPTPAGHGKIAEAIEERLSQGESASPTGDPCASLVEYRYGNPDYALGGDEDFFDHFHLRVSPPDPRPASLADRSRAVPYERILAAQSGLAPLPDGVDRGGLDVLAHPFLGWSRLLAFAPPEEPTDLGAAPSFYRLRLGASVLADGEARNNAVKAAPNLDPILPRPDRLESWIHAIGVSECCLEKRALKEAVEDGLKSGAIFDRIEARIARALGEGHQPGNRWRTSRSWFFREALWFGTPSSEWIFLDREGIAAAAESLVMIDAIADEESTRTRARERLAALGDEVGRLSRRQPACPAAVSAP